MDKHTYFVGAKPAIERALRDFHRSHACVDIGMTSSTQALKVGVGAVADNPGDWPSAGIPQSVMGIDDFSESGQRAVLIYNGRALPMEVFVRRPRLSGEA